MSPHAPFSPLRAKGSSTAQLPICALPGWLPPPPHHGQLSFLDIRDKTLLVGPRKKCPCVRRDDNLCCIHWKSITLRPVQSFIKFLAGKLAKYKWSLCHEIFFWISSIFFRQKAARWAKKDLKERLESCLVACIPAHDFFWEGMGKAVIKHHFRGENALFGDLDGYCCPWS